MSKEDPVRVIYTHYLNLIRSRLRRTSRNVRLAGALALALTLLSTSYGTWRWWTGASRDIAQARTLLRKNSGLKGKDGSRIIFVPYKDVSKKVVIHPTKATTFDAHRRLFLNPPRATRMTSGAATPAFGPPAQTKPGLNLAFLHQFLSLLNIMIPHFRSKETGLLFSHGVFLDPSNISITGCGEARRCNCPRFSSWQWQVVHVRHSQVVVRGYAGIIHQRHDQILAIKDLYCISYTTDALHT